MGCVKLIWASTEKISSAAIFVTLSLCYHLGDLFHRLPLLDVLHDQLVKHLLLDVLHDHLVKHLLLPVSRKSQEKCAKKRRKKLGVAVVLLANVFFGGWEMSEFGGGKCPNFGGGKCPPGK